MEKRIKRILSISLSVLVSTLLVAGVAMAVTTISENIVTQGTLAVTGASTLTGLLNANGGIAVDTSAFTVADTSGNTAIAGTLAVTGASTLTGTLAANGGVTVDTDNFIVDGTTGAVTAEAGITLSGATGVNELRIPTNLADALSIEDTAGDLIVFDTTTGTQILTITPATTITGALTFGTSLKNTAIPMATTVTRPVNFTSAPTNTSYLNKELAYFRADLDVTKNEAVAGEDGFTVGMFRAYLGASQGGAIIEGLRAGVNLDDSGVIVSDGAGAGYIAGARITTYVPATSNAKTNKGLIVAPRDNSALAAISGSQYIGQQLYLMQTVAKSESWGLDIYTESGSADLNAAINIRNGGTEKYAYGIDMNDATTVGTADIRLSNGNVISNAVAGTISFGAANLTTTGLLLKSFVTGLTAQADASQANATALTKDINVVTTVAGANDSVKLPTAVAGMEITVINRTATAMDVFGQTGANINAAGDNLAYAVAGNVTAKCFAIDALTWECVKSVR